MDGARRDKQLVSGLGLVDLTFDFELHPAFEHRDELIGWVPEIFPALTGGVNFDLTTLRSPASGIRESKPLASSRVSRRVMSESLVGIRTPISAQEALSVSGAPRIRSSSY